MHLPLLTPAGNSNLNNFKFISVLEENDKNVASDDFLSPPKTRTCLGNSGISHTPKGRWESGKFCYKKNDEEIFKNGQEWNKWSWTKFFKWIL